MNPLLPAEIDCPFCFESIVVTIDTTQGNHEMIEDCEVCCRPMRLAIECSPGRLEDVSVEPA